MGHLSIVAMTPSANRLIYPATLTTFSPFSPKPQISHQNLHQQKNKRLQIRSDLSRRDAVSWLSLLTLVPFISQPSPATAFSIGISGPKDWLKAQKRKASKFLLAPIDASRESLRSAYVLLVATSDYNYNDEDLEGIQRVLRSAARDCVPQEWNSFVEFQANTGVEVCTFRLIVNNASSLLDARDPVKLEAEGMLNDLIRAFTYLNGLASKTDIQLASSRLMVADALKDTISSLNKFEQGVMACLEA